VIGAKVLATIALTLIGLGTALGLGALSPERLAARGFSDLFLVGCFGVVVGTMMFRLWGFGEPSHHYFRWATDAALWEGAEGHFLGSGGRRITIGENRGDALDFAPWLQHALCVLASLLIGLACLDARGLGLLREFTRGSAASSAYCPAEEAQPATAVVEDVNAPGCELIRRAFSLGYTDSLGDCAPKTRTETAEPRPPCTLRQRDEPSMHYAWRLLSKFWAGLSAGADPRFTGARREFGKKLDHLGALTSAQRQVLDSSPHASHHIWTNLPDPGGAFRPETCGDRYRWLAHRPAPGSDDKRAGRIFEHVIAQLLFEARYEPAVASCREVHVHFGAAPDTCARLAAQPEAVLAASGALRPVRAALERHRVATELTALGGRPPGAEPGAFLSFQCYIEGEAAPRQSRPFTLGGHALMAEEIRVQPPAGDAALFSDRYDAISRLLVRSFHYGALLSEAGLQQPEGAIAGSFAGGDYLLSRLYGLENVDLYLDPSWIATRPDLLEVYPYQRHLKNYVQMFRRQYKNERGRL
jgi:hypothetical protein